MSDEEGFVAVQRDSPGGSGPVYVGTVEDVVDNPRGTRVEVDYGEDTFGAVYREEFLSYLDAEDVFIPEPGISPGIYSPGEVSKSRSLDQGELDAGLLERLEKYTADFKQLERGDSVRLLTARGEVVEGTVNNAPMAGGFGRVQLEEDSWSYRLDPRGSGVRDVAAYRVADEDAEAPITGEADESGLEAASGALEPAKAADGGEQL